MAHLSPVNGAYPHKDQIDRSCLVATDNLELDKLIERGTIIYVNKSGEFTTVTDSADVTGPMYFALQPYGDMQAAMAGNVGLGKGQKVPAYKGVTGAHTKDGHDAAAWGQPKITGLSFQEHGNYQTDMYDDDTYDIGDPLKVVNGKFAKADDEDEAVAHVYAAPDDYYFNGAVLQEGWSTGAWIKVLRVSL